MNRTCFTITAIGAAVGIASIARAHHSAAPHFDMDNPVDIEGVVTQFRFVNPHAYVYFDVTDDTGAVATWRCELSSATGMTRRGWTAESLSPGQAIAVNGAPARREDNVCYTNYMELGDGIRVSRNDPPPGSEAVAAAQDTLGVPDGWSAYLPNGQPNLGGPWVRQGMGGMGPGTAGVGAPPGGAGAARTGSGPGEANAPAGGAGPAGMAGAAPGGFGFGGMAGFAPGSAPPGFPAPTEAGRAAAADYEQPFDDPAIFCHPANIIFGFTHDSHVNDIYQTDDAVTLQYGYMDLIRTIHLDRTEHPDDIAPGVGGHSIGRWEGDVLVVDTIGFEQGVVFPLSGLMHSADMQVTERFEVRDDGRTLVRSYVARDPAFLQTDWVGESVFQRTSEPYEPYNCTELSGENNRRPAP